MSLNRGQQVGDSCSQRQAVAACPRSRDLTVSLSEWARRRMEMLGREHRCHGVHGHGVH